MNIDKKKRMVEFILLITIVILLLICIYLLITKKEKPTDFDNKKIDNVQSKEETLIIPREEEKKEEEVINSNLDEQQEIKEDLSLISEKLMDKIKKYHLYIIEEDKKSVQYNDIPTAESLYAMFDYYKIAHSYDGYMDYELKTNITKTEVDTYFKEVFNVKLKEYPNYQCWEDGEDVPLYEYNKDTNEYVFEPEKHGHGDYHDIESYVDTDIEKIEDTKYAITLVKIRYTEGGYYINDDFYDSIDDAIKAIRSTSNKGKFPRFKYTFKEVNGNYYLTSLDKID